VLEGVILAQAATLPLILAWFGTVSITSIAANALLAPLMWIAFPLCFLLAGLVVLMPAIASWLAVLALVPLAASLVVVQSLAQLAPPLMLGGTGPAAVIMVAVPCALVTLWWARDAHRWLPRVHRVWREQPWRVEAALLAPAVAILLVLVSIAAGW
jgi:hypothetical protein